MFDLIARVLAWFYDFSGSYAISIVLLTFLIMLILTPLTLKGTRSMMRIQQLQPELKRIQAEHKGDRQKVNEATMALYKQHGANPLAGCLPTLVQLPVFIVLYRVINGMTKMGGDGVPNPSYLKKDSVLYQDLVADNGEMVSFGIDLSEAAKDVIQANFVDGLPYLALVAITFVLSFLQQAQMKAHRGDAAAQNPQMEMLMKIMPYMLPVFAFLVQAALGVYFIASSLYRIAQQAFIHKTMKPVTTAATPIEAELIEEEPPTKEVTNQRSKKAVAAQDERRKARDERSKQRRSGRRPPSTESESPKAQKSKNEEEQNPIQSKRTSGDGRTKKRRK
ncbi:MAG: membrane protein insertase YidC [Acidimicrobiales bacterium]|jgi:YidC/Oxa1 family membrane protein insertase|nr:membrane protein insertase YidC [Acidimicrobiales bacterium]MDP6900809.1 membrane protein insertase YidC [Acidimicrobiales bacterium]HJL99200.1 membrane protein insertase YidC [Acidimicrobiales bacterium]